MSNASIAMAHAGYLGAIGPELAPAAAGAVLIGVSLGMLGSGGSILAVPLLIYIVGHGEKQSIIEALAIVGVISLVSMLLRAKAGQVSWRSAAIFAPSSMLGAACGAWTANFVTGSLQIGLLAIVMLASAWVMLRGRRAQTLPPDPGDPAADPAIIPGPVVVRAVWPILLSGLVVGLLTGLVGVGGGFLIVPALTAFVGLAPPIAVGTSLALIALNCAVGFGTYAATHDSLGVDWAVIALFSVIGSAGAILGQRIAKNMNQRRFRQVFAIFLLALAPLLLWRASGL